ncbi:MAG: FkbM family methyltransferase [Chloroflexota bacterium]
MSYKDGFDANRGAWNATKGLLWRILSLGGERSGDRAWMIYSLARAFVDANIKKTFTAELEESFVRRSVKKGQICIDVGANIGSFTHLLSMLVGLTGQVHSIEPTPSAFDVLSKRVALFRLKNVRCHPVALGDCEGIGELVGGTGRPGDRAFAHLKASAENEAPVIQNIPLTTLDSLVADQNIGHIEFIKCDVEGFELMVFTGGQNVLTQYRPIVLCEVEDRWMRYGYTTADFFLLFHTLGYSSFVWREGRLSSVDGALPYVNNYIYIPQERVDAVVSELRG